MNYSVTVHTIHSKSNSRPTTVADVEVISSFVVVARRQLATLIQVCYHMTFWKVTSNRDNFSNYHGNSDKLRGELALLLSGLLCNQKFTGSNFHHVRIRFSAKLWIVTVIQLWFLNPRFSTNLWEIGQRLVCTQVQDTKLEQGHKASDHRR